MIAVVFASGCANSASQEELEPHCDAGTRFRLEGEIDDVRVEIAKSQVSISYWDAEEPGNGDLSVAFFENSEQGYVSFTWFDALGSGGSSEAAANTYGVPGIPGWVSNCFDPFTPESEVWSVSQAIVPTNGEIELRFHARDLMSNPTCDGTETAHTGSLHGCARYVPLS